MRPEHAPRPSSLRDTIRALVTALPTLGWSCAVQLVAILVLLITMGVLAVVVLLKLLR